MFWLQLKTYFGYREVRSSRQTAEITRHENLPVYSITRPSVHMSVCSFCSRAYLDVFNNSGLQIVLPHVDAHQLLDVLQHYHHQLGQH